MKARSSGPLLLALLLAWTAVSPAARAVEPRLVAAQRRTVVAAPDLTRQVRALAREIGTGWIAYSVPIKVDRSWICCHAANGRCTRCLLRGQDVTALSDGPSPGCPGTPADLIVYLRAAGGGFDFVRMFSDNCEVDAGGMPVVWLTGVAPAASLDTLSALVLDFAGRGLGQASHATLGAMARHADPAADRHLADLAAPGRPNDLRKRVPFWLGEARGAEGLKVLRRLVQDDPSPRIRERAVFGLSASKEPEALELLTQVARGDDSSYVRGQALFWLAHKAGKKAGATIESAATSDEELEVRKQAIFALSKLPAAEAVPRLIRVARTHPDAALRKEAVFWLGRSKDPRALEFFEEVLGIHNGGDR